MRRRAFDLQLGPAANEPRPAGVTEADLAAIGIPVLAVSGAHDVPDFHAVAARLAEV